jgi:hypothetical protein
MASVNGWPRWAKAFLAALEVDGIVLRAAKAAEISPRQAYRYRKENKEFFAAWEEAEQIGSETLVQAAYIRAVEGWDENITANGRVIGTKRVYSDQLLALMLKAKRPTEYRERQSVEVSGKDGGAIEINDGRAKLAQLLAGRTIRSGETSDPEPTHGEGSV